MFLPGSALYNTSGSIAGRASGSLSCSTAGCTYGSPPDSVFASRSRSTAIKPSRPRRRRCRKVNVNPKQQFVKPQLMLIQQTRTKPLRLITAPEIAPSRGIRTPACFHAPWAETTSEHLHSSRWPQHDEPGDNRSIGLARHCLRVTCWCPGGSERQRNGASDNRACHV